MLSSKSGKLLTLWRSQYKLNSTTLFNDLSPKILGKSLNYGVSNQLYRCESNKAGEVKSTLPQHMPTKLDRLTLKLTKTVPADQIGNEVSHSLMEKANSRRRIGINVFLLFFTGFGALFAMYLGKRDSKTQNVYIRNVDRYKEEVQKSEN